MALFGNPQPAYPAAPQPAPQPMQAPQQFQQPVQAPAPQQYAPAPQPYVQQQPMMQPPAQPQQHFQQPQQAPQHHAPMPATPPMQQGGVVMAQPNIFGGMRDQKVNPDSNWFGAGTYWVRVDKVKQGQNRANVSNVIAELTIIRVWSAWNNERTHQVGEQVAQFFDGKFPEYFKQDLKKFAAGAFTDRFNTIDPNTVDENDIAQICGKKITMVNGVSALVDDMVPGPDGQLTLSQPLRGMILEYSNYMRKSKDKIINGAVQEGRWRTQYKVVRNVMPDEALATLTPEEQARFFPGNFLQNQLNVLMQAGRIPVPFVR